MATHLDTIPTTPARSRAPAAPRVPAPERRVLVVVRFPLGGIRTHVLYNYPAVAERGYRFTFVAPADGALDTFAATLRALEGAEFVGVPARGARCPLWPAVRRLVRSGRFDLMHSHGFTAAVHAVLGNLGGGLPHLSTIHDVVRPEQFPGLKGRLRRRLLGWLLRRVDTIIPVGADVRQNLLDLLPPLRARADRLVTVRNGITLDPGLDDEPGALQRQLGLAPGTALLGFLGRFMEQKGFLPLLEALRLLRAGGAYPPFHLAAFGSGDYEREYRRAVERYGLSDCVSLLPFVPDVRPVLRQLDLLVVPSLWEACPLVPLEGMVAGVPVLGTDCIGLREVLTGTPSRVVRAGDPADLCRGLHAALTDPWTETARAFVPTARRLFDNAPAARRLADLFDQSVGVTV